MYQQGTKCQKYELLVFHNSAFLLVCPPPRRRCFRKCTRSFLSPPFFLSFFLPLRIFNCYLPCHPLPLVPCQPAPLSLVPSSTCPLVNSSLGSTGLPARNHTFAPLQAHLCPQAGSPLPGRLGKGDLWQWWGQGWGRCGIFRALCFFNYNL